MKTFNKSDLITWANHDKAIIGNNYYFADSLDNMECKVEKGEIGTLIDINGNEVITPFKIKSNFYSYACILPIDAVKEEKKYRPLKNIKELFKLINDSNLTYSENECIYELVSDCVIHYRSKVTGREWYSRITRIAIDGHNYILFLDASYSLLNLFNGYDIEINGEWQPFGVLNED